MEFGHVTAGSVEALLLTCAKLALAFIYLVCLGFVRYVCWPGTLCNVCLKWETHLLDAIPSLVRQSEIINTQHCYTAGLLV